MMENIISDEILLFLLSFGIFLIGKFTLLIINDLTSKIYHKTTDLTKLTIKRSLNWMRKKFNNINQRSNDYSFRIEYSEPSPFTDTIAFIDETEKNYLNDSIPIEGRNREKLARQILGDNKDFVTPPLIYFDEDEGIGIHYTILTKHYKNRYYKI